MPFEFRAWGREGLRGILPAVGGHWSAVFVEDDGEGDGLAGEERFEPILQLLVVVREQRLTGEGVELARVVLRFPLGGARQGFVERTPMGVGEAGDDEEQYGAGSQQDLEAEGDVAVPVHRESSGGEAYRRSRSGRKGAISAKSASVMGTKRR